MHHLSKGFPFAMAVRGLPFCAMCPNDLSLCHHFKAPPPELLIQGFSPLQGLSKSPLLAPPFKGFSISTISKASPFVHAVQGQPHPSGHPSRPPHASHPGTPSAAPLSPLSPTGPLPPSPPGFPSSAQPWAEGHSPSFSTSSMPSMQSRLLPPRTPHPPWGQQGRSGPRGCCPAWPGRTLTSVKEIVSSQPVPLLDVRESSGIGGCSFSFLFFFLYFPL